MIVSFRDKPAQAIDDHLQSDRDLWHELHSPEAREIERIERLLELA